MTLSGDQHIIFDSNSAEGQKFIDEPPVEQATLLSVSLRIEQRRNEVESGFDGENHAGFELPCEPEERVLCGSLVEFSLGILQVPSHIMNLNSEKVPKAMWKEKPADGMSFNFSIRARDDSGLFKQLADFPVGFYVEIGEGKAGLRKRHDLPLKAIHAFQESTKNRVCIVAGIGASEI